MRIATLLLSSFLSPVLAGCVGDGSSSTEAIDREAFDLNGCAPADGMGTFQPGAPVDYLELRGEDGSRGRTGTRCGGATDVPACERDFEALLAPDEWYLRTDGGAPAPGFHLRFTRGDEVGVVGASALGAFLAPLDAVEAAYLARAEARAEVDCGIPSVAETPGGFDVFVTQTATCGGRRTEMRVFVGTDGDATVLDQIVTSEGEDLVCP